MCDVDLLPPRCQVHRRRAVKRKCRPEEEDEGYVNGHIDTSLRPRLTQEETMSLGMRLHRAMVYLALFPCHPGSTYCRWPGNEADSCGHTQCMHSSGYECTCPVSLLKIQLTLTRVLYQLLHIQKLLFTIASPVGRKQLPVSIHKGQQYWYHEIRHS